MCFKHTLIIDIYGGVCDKEWEAMGWVVGYAIGWDGIGGVPGR